MTTLTRIRCDLVDVSCTFCLGWLGEDTTTVLQIVRAMKKSMMSARSEGSWDMGWLWKRMKSIWLLHSLTLSRSWGSGVISFSCRTDEGLSADRVQQNKDLPKWTNWPWGCWRPCAWIGYWLAWPPPCCPSCGGTLCSGSAAPPGRSGGWSHCPAWAGCRHEMYTLPPQNPSLGT